MSEDAQIAASVQKHGWHAIAVEGDGDEPPFLYTIGLAHTFEHPEIVVCGLDSELMYGLASDVVSELRAGKKFEPGQRYGGFLEGHVIAFRAVHATQIAYRLGYAMGFYRQTPERLAALQLIWPDRSGALPGDAQCDPEILALQPSLQVGIPRSERRRGD